MPGARYTTKDGKSTYSWGIGGWDPINVAVAGKTDAYSDGWTRYNFAGYEGRPAYGEYKAPGRHDGRPRRQTPTPTSAAAARCGRTTAPTARTARRWR